MRIKEYADTDAGQVMIGLITDTVVCSRISTIWTTEGLFDDPDMNLIARWCLKYMEEYRKPPRDAIKQVFKSWASGKNVSEDRAIVVERKLIELSAASKINTPDTNFALDAAERVFNRVQLEREWDRAETDLETGDPKRAIERMQSLNRIELRSGRLIKPAEEFTPWREAFDPDVSRPLLSYPGSLDEFLGKSMVRDGFVSFMAPDKSFKSIYLLDAAFRGVGNRKRVAFFEAGDLSQKQVIRRISLRAVGRPMYPGQWSVPITVSSTGAVTGTLKETTKIMRAGEAYRAFQKLSRKTDFFRLSCHPNNSLTVAGIESIIRNWVREGWVPDIVIIDYADILAPPSGIRESLDQIDEIWKNLRRISQERNCLVLTATQSSAAAYSKKTPTLGRQHFSGRKTKLAHVSGMVGINVTDVFRNNSVSGLNWIVNREGVWSENYMKVVAGCMAIGNPCIVVSSS